LGSSFYGLSNEYTQIQLRPYDQKIPADQLSYSSEITIPNKTFTLRKFRLAASLADDGNTLTATSQSEKLGKHSKALLTRRTPAVPTK
jgi:hypothetical protein